MTDDSVEVTLEAVAEAVKSIFGSFLPVPARGKTGDSGDDTSVVDVADAVDGGNLQEMEKNICGNFTHSYCASSFILLYSLLFSYCYTDIRINFH